MLLNILTFFLIRNALKMFQTLLIPTAIPHRCSLSCFIGLYLSICPPNHHLFIHFLSYESTRQPAPARPRPLGSEFPSSPYSQENLEDFYF